MLIRAHGPPRINRSGRNGQLCFGHMAAGLVLRHDEIARVYVLRQIHHGARQVQLTRGAVAMPAINHHPVVQGDGVLHAQHLNGILQLLKFLWRHAWESSAQWVLHETFRQCGSFARPCGRLKITHGIPLLDGLCRYCFSS